MAGPDVAPGSYVSPPMPKSPQAISNDATSGPAPASIIKSQDTAASNDATSGVYPPPVYVNPGGRVTTSPEAGKFSAQTAPTEANPRMKGLIDFTANKMAANGPFYAGRDVDVSDYPDFGNFTPGEIDSAKSAARFKMQGIVNTTGANGVTPKYDMWGNPGNAQTAAPVAAAPVAATPKQAKKTGPSKGWGPGESTPANAQGNVQQRQGTGELGYGQPTDDQIKEAANKLNPQDWSGFFKLAGNLLDAYGVSRSAYGGVQRKTMLQQEFANKLQIEQQKQQAMNQAKATISTLEPKAAAQIEQIRAEYEASGDKDVYVSKLNQARNLDLIDEAKYTNLLNAAVSPASMIGGGKTAAVTDLKSPGEMP